MCIRDSACNIGYFGKEVIVRNFQFLVANKRLIWAKPGSAGRLIKGGVEKGKLRHVCRVSYKNAWHPGKTVGQLCKIGYGGKELAFKRFELLLQR